MLPEKKIIIESRAEFLRYRRKIMLFAYLAPVEKAFLETH